MYKRQSREGGPKRQHAVCCMDNEREEEKEMKKISFNGNWVYHEGGGGALQSLMGGGQDTGCLLYTSRCV